MEGDGFSFKFVSNLSIRCDKVNAPKISLCTKSANWLKYKNTTINPNNFDGRFFQNVFALTQHYKRIEKHPERVSKTKPFLNLLNRYLNGYRISQNCK